jgi:hypothetical protein
MILPEKAKNLIKRLSETFDLFDDEEPMCSEARDVFRKEIVPMATQLLDGLTKNGDLDNARLLVEVFGHVRYFVEVNGPASLSNIPDDDLLQRCDLNEEEKLWRP